MKTIHIDGSVLSRQIASGISNYLVNICNYFKRYEEQYGLQTKTFTPGKIPHNNIFFRNAGPSDEIFFQLSYPEFIRQMMFPTNLHCDIYHSPYMFLPPRNKSHSNVLTVHDLINIKYSHGAGATIRKHLLTKAINRADYLICISLATKAELLDLFPRIQEKQIYVIPQGIDQSLFLTNSINEKAIDRKPYLVYIGQRSGYKNFNAMIGLMSNTSIREKMDLICIGGGSFGADEQKQFQQAGLSGAIRHAGYVETNELKDLYTNAIALVYPSLEEGFGLPILEAMACGCPVITGNFSAMKEVAGSYGILVEDYSVDSLIHGIEKSLTLSAGQKNNAKEYARNFTWEKTAIETLKVYVSILGQRG